MMRLLIDLNKHRPMLSTFSIVFGVLAISMVIKNESSAYRIRRSPDDYYHPRPKPDPNRDLDMAFKPDDQFDPNAPPQQQQVVPPYFPAAAAFQNRQPLLQPQQVESLGYSQGSAFLDDLNHHLQNNRRGKSFHGPTKSAGNNPFAFEESVVNVTGKGGGIHDLSAFPWKADCNGHMYSYRFGWIVGIWNDDDHFDDLDFIKCQGPKEFPSPDVYYSDEQRTGTQNFDTFKLDLYDQKLLDFNVPYAQTCEDGYLLTALWSDNDDFTGIKFGKCTRLRSGTVDHSSCEDVKTENKSNGTHEPNENWGVECHRDSAAVGIHVLDSRHVESLKCCKILPPLSIA